MKNIGMDVGVSKRSFAARVFLFAVALLWDLVFLGIGLLLVSPFIDYLETFEGIAYWIVICFVMWYLITLTAIAVYAALSAFNTIGRWTSGK